MMESPGALPSRGLVFQLVYCFHRYWAYSSKSTVWPKMEPCFQDRACSVSSFMLRLLSIELMMSSNHLILCCPLFLLPSIFPSFSLSQWVSSSHQVAKVLELQFSISPSNEYSGLISLRIDWFDLHAVQGTLKSLLQHHNLKTSILWHLAFFMVQLSYLYMTTRETITLTIPLAKW